MFFDNLSVQHYTGPITEETHYYPFGLTMEGISNKALENPQNCGCGIKKGFNGNELQQKEFSDGNGLEVYDFIARTYDPQIGRFIQIDPISEEGGQESLNPYHFGTNNPILYNDPDGECPICPAIPAAVAAAEALGTAIVVYAATDAASKVTADALRNGSGNTVTNYSFAWDPTYVNTWRTSDVKGTNVNKGLNSATSTETVVLYKPKDIVKPKADGKVPNPDGAKGKPDHQNKVKELTEKAKSEAKRGEQVLSEKKIQGHDSNRRPDVQIVDETGKARKTFEAERKPNSQRNKKREEEYKKLNVETETHKVGN